MFQQDEIDKFELLRDIAEHNAMFQNSDGVRQVRDARENAIHVPEDEFKQQIEETFGRAISFDKTDQEIVPKKSLDIYKDFDEIEFVPFGG